MRRRRETCLSLHSSGTSLGVVHMKALSILFAAALVLLPAYIGFMGVETERPLVYSSLV